MNNRLEKNTTNRIRLNRMIEDADRKAMFKLILIIAFLRLRAWLRQIPNRWVTWQAGSHE